MAAPVLPSSSLKNFRAHESERVDTPVLRRDLKGEGLVLVHVGGVFEDIDAISSLQT